MLWFKYIFDFIRYFVDIVLQVGDSSSAVVAIPEANPVFEAPAQFSIDGLTEKVVTIFVTFISHFSLDF